MASHLRRYPIDASFLERRTPSREFPLFWCSCLHHFFFLWTRKKKKKKKKKKKNEVDYHLRVSCSRPLCGHHCSFLIDHSVSIISTSFATITCHHFCSLMNKSSKEVVFSPKFFGPDSFGPACQFGQTFFSSDFFGTPDFSKKGTPRQNSKKRGFGILPLPRQLHCDPYSLAAVCCWRPVFVVLITFCPWLKSVCLMRPVRYVWRKTQFFAWVVAGTSA